MTNRPEIKKVTCIRVTLLLFLGLGGLSWAQKAPDSTQEIAIRAGRLLDVRTGHMLRDQQILIRDGIITAVVPDSGAPKSGTVIDLRQATVLPGLIDAHEHITGDPDISDLDKVAISDARRALKGARNARVTLEAGFTTIRNVGADGFPDVALRDAINDGDVIGPRILASGLHHN